MDRLQRVVAFWRDCITSEGALEQSFSIAGTFSFGIRNRARLFKSAKDPFIFGEPPYKQVIEKGETYEFIARASLKGQEIYFGYPMLMFYDVASRQHRVAPLFVIRLSVELYGDGLVLTRGEPTPMLGSKAFECLGLKQEEIAALNTEISEIFDSSQKSKLETILYLLKRETTMTFVEGIDPERLSSAQTIHPYTGTVIYNRAVIYASEATSYNLHILNDLSKLTERNDLHTTALDYLRSPGGNGYSDLAPVLPFAFDEYQLQAIRHIMGSKYTVVTGPPGTGKSQFIANLIINLFLQKKRVLFVSHTGEAVRVVNERVNEQFTNLMMQTGRKEIRQDLGRRLAEMVAAHNEQQVSSHETVRPDQLKDNWGQIVKDTSYLKKNNALHAHLERLLAKHGRTRSTFARSLYGWRVRRLTRRLRHRLASRVVATRIAELKTEHVKLSRSYVKANYLNLILRNELYGKLVAYIEAVQNRRPLQTRSIDHSDRYVDAALQAMNIWSCTLKSLAATFPLRANLFDYVIFDEASQIDLPSAAPALYRANNMVVVGDAKQLNHIAKINQDKEEELALQNDLLDSPIYPGLISYREASLFNSAKRALTEPEQQLKNHYRSDPAIANLFSSIFYSGKLRLRTPDRALPKGIHGGVQWEDVAGTAYKHKNGSRYNREEVDRVVQLVGELLPSACKQGLHIGIATPYSMQRELIARKLTSTFSSDELIDVRALTVHQFQGSEVDILLFSTVVAQGGDGNSDYWYMRNEQILNVAVSRARQVLIIVGDREFALQSQSKLKDIAEHCLAINQAEEVLVPNRPMNIFEHRLLECIQPNVTKSFSLEPQFVIDGRYTVDFALRSRRKKIAVELDGAQHEIIGDLPVLEDLERDAYLTNRGWQIIRIPVHELLRHPDKVRLRIRQAVRSTPVAKKKT